MSGVRIVVVAALASALCLTVFTADAQAARAASGMTAGQKASATRATKGKHASCKRSANRQGLSFDARRAFMRQCLAV